jgi:hypothetical protein
MSFIFYYWANLIRENKTDQNIAQIGETKRFSRGPEKRTLGRSRNGQKCKIQVDQ